MNTKQAEDSKRNFLARGSAKLLDHVFTSTKAFTEAIAQHHVIIDLGHEWLVEDESCIESAWQQLLENHADALGESEGIQQCESHMETFNAVAHKQAQLVMDKALPLTLRNAETFWPLEV